MSVPNHLEDIAVLTSRINAEVIRAIALQALWARCANEADVLYVLGDESAFRLLRDSLQIDLLMTLMRLYDRPKQANASIPHVIQKVSEPITISCLDLNAKTYAEQAKEKYQEVEKTGILKRIRALRDRVLAHNDTRKLDDLARYGDETKLLENTEAIAGLLHRTVTGSQPQFDFNRQCSVLSAKSFWSRAMQGDATYDGITKPCY